MIKMFGLEIGAKLLPYKGVSIFIAVFLMPIFIYLAINKISFDAIFTFLGFMCIFGIILANKIK